MGYGMGWGMPWGFGLGLVGMVLFWTAVVALVGVLIGALRGRQERPGDGR